MDTTIIVAIVTAFFTIGGSFILFFLKSISKVADELKLENKENQKEIRNIAERLVRMELHQENAISRLSIIEDRLNQIEDRLNQIETNQRNQNRSGIGIESREIGMMIEGVMKKEGRVPTKEIKQQNNKNKIENN